MFVIDLYRYRRPTSHWEPAAVGVVPGDVKGEQDQVRSDGRSDDRGGDGRKAAGCVEPEPGSDESAADRRRESGGLGLRGPVAVHPGQVDPEADWQAAGQGDHRVAVNRHTRQDRQYDQRAEEDAAEAEDDRG